MQLSHSLQMHLIFQSDLQKGTSAAQALISPEANQQMSSKPTKLTKLFWRGKEKGKRFFQGRKEVPQHLCIELGLWMGCSAGMKRCLATLAAEWKEVAVGSECGQCPLCSLRSEG